MIYSLLRAIQGMIALDGSMTPIPVIAHRMLHIRYLSYQMDFVTFLFAITYDK